MQSGGIAYDLYALPNVILVRDIGLPLLFRNDSARLSTGPIS